MLKYEIVDWVVVAYKLCYETIFFPEQQNTDYYYLKLLILLGKLARTIYEIILMRFYECAKGFTGANISVIIIRINTCAEK